MAGFQYHSFSYLTNLELGVTQLHHMFPAKRHSPAKCSPVLNELGQYPVTDRLDVVRTSLCDPDPPVQSTLDCAGLGEPRQRRRIPKYV